MTTFLSCPVLFPKVTCQHCYDLVECARPAKLTTTTNGGQGTSIAWSGGVGQQPAGAAAALVGSIYLYTWSSGKHAHTSITWYVHHREVGGEAAAGRGVLCFVGGERGGWGIIVLWRACLSVR